MEDAPFDISDSLEISLKNIDISNYDEEYLVADSSFSEIFSISFLRPIFIIILGFILSPLSLYEDYYQKRTIIFSSTNFSDKFQGSFLSPYITSWNRHIYVFAHFSKPFGFSQYVNGYLDLKFKKNSKILSEYHSHFYRIDINKPFPLLLSENLDFNHIQGTFVLQDIFGQPSTLNTLWIFGSINYSNLYLIIRIIFSTCILFSFLNLINPTKETDVNSTNQDNRSLIQVFTLYLLIIVFLYLDPLLILHYIIPSSFYLFLDLFLRDFTFSFCLFYILSLFSSLINKISIKTKDYSTIQRLTPFFVPYSIGVLLFVFLLVNDCQYSYFKKVHIFPKKIVFHDSISIFHCFVALVFIIVFNIYAIRIRNNISNNQNNRWSWYFYFSEIFLFLFTLYLFLAYFGLLSWIEGTILIKLIPLSLFTLFSLYMSKIHLNPQIPVEFNQCYNIGDGIFEAEEDQNQEKKDTFEN